jgi:hypothetical protein
MTKVRACKVASQEGSLRVTFHVHESVGKCEGITFTFPRKLPLWELESRWTSEFLESDCRGQNSMD